jgi:hypothetical protein
MMKAIDKSRVIKASDLATVSTFDELEWSGSNAGDRNRSK